MTTTTSTMTTSTLTSIWPAAAPLPGEELIFSIVVGNTHLYWATHFGEGGGFHPQMFWRTTHVKEMSDDNSPAEVLSWHLSEYSNDYVFGKTDNPTSAAAHEQSKQRATRGGGRTISIYIVSASTTSTTSTSIINTTTLDQNNVQEQRIAGMWSAVPSRVFVIGKDAFFPNEEKGQPPHPCGLVAYSRYHDTLAWRVDHLALLAGAVHMYGHPVLVFDASRQPKDVTYTSTNSNGKILDVGIPVGIGKGQQYVIRNWLRKASSAEVSSFSTSQHFSKFNTERRVLCNRGDDSMILQLQPSHGQRYMVEASNHILHYGITCVLVRQVGWRGSSHRSPPAIFAADLSLSAESPPPTEKMASLTIADDDAAAGGDDDIEEDATEDVDFNEYLGKRVAKVFLDEDADDESFRTYRGSVKEVPGQGDEDPFFTIHFDDGDKHSVYIDELKNMLRLFEEVGEDTSSPSKPTRKSRRKSMKPARFIDSSSATKKAAPAKENFNKKKPTKNNKKKSKKSRK